MRSLKSIKFRLAALSTLVSAVTLGVLSWFLYQGIKDSQQAAFDTSLYNHAVDVANATDLSVLGQLILKRDAIVDKEKFFPFPLGQSVVQFRTIDGAVFWSSRPLDFIRLPLSRQTMLETVNQGATFESTKGPREYRIVNYLMQKPPLPPLILQVAVPTTLLELERAQILSLFWALIPIALIATAFGGLWLAERALNPVKKITKTAQSIQAKELSARVPVPSETELKELALTLNELLSRLQKAFDGQEKFIADASHQLKTPLAIIRGEIDVFRRTGQNENASAPLLESVSQEINQLSKMVDDLLLLARFDSGLLSPQPEKLRVDEVVMEAVSQLDRLSREQKVDVRFDIEASPEDATGFEAMGDADLFRVLFFNLIENAIKYSPKPGLVKVRLASIRDGGTRAIQVDVEDQGPGIDPGELSRVFDRFFRGSERQLQAPGVGLGLSIASRIAKLYGADLTAKSEIGKGATFSVRIACSD